MNAEATEKTDDAEDAHWETWDRARFLKLVEKLHPVPHMRIGIFHTGNSQYSVCRVWPRRSVHLTFEEREGNPQSVCVTRMSQKDDRASSTSTDEIVWLRGGFRAWIDELEIGRDDLVIALLEG